MNTYKVTGTSREVGAIGIFEPFAEYITTEKSKDAYTQARQNQDAKNRDYILVTGVFVENSDGWGNNYWVAVEPEAYLYPNL